MQIVCTLQVPQGRISLHITNFKAESVNIQFSLLLQQFDHHIINLLRVIIVTTQWFADLPLRLVLLASAPRSGGKNVPRCRFRDKKKVCCSLNQEIDWKPIAHVQG